MTFGLLCGGELRPEDLGMGVMVDWESGADRPSRVVLPLRVEQLIARAARLDLAEIAELDLEASRRWPHIQSVAWDLLRDRLDRAGLSQARSEARRWAWAAVNASLSNLGLELVPDDGYWRIRAGSGTGAARAARWAACALLAPDGVEHEVLEPMLGPWLQVIGLPRSIEHPGAPGAPGRQQRLDEQEHRPRIQLGGMDADIEHLLGDATSDELVRLDVEPTSSPRRANASAEGSE